mmetsp:Transcript_1477/g.3985  ORF Transcript_1477/g.3985 Transcript_1477/m.3985 type:complete len:202 (+) Transcript_1477:83-688(+)|eukprot:CAMPEP_0113687586 /NCGR_PEP_ID=MMETSP0038_2-20120614/16025_1 /TAXON_ID=2898 /ORGANISM="Cryptomonas paramecium" /LENGTH=201 /DNA_ID=CAMNT_0000608231 /DNA_START=94 /DNA_END=699 /DNA_ORIENTATION=+ /assembly_acc=CAM_ASM_000170
MPTQFFPEVTASWKLAADKIVDNKVPAVEFLKAAEEFVPIFDRLGTIFTPVKADVGGNVKKLKDAHAANPVATIHELVIAEKAEGKHKLKTSASVALLWFKRAMQFIFTLLQKVSTGLDANKAAKEAYAETLAHYHGFMVKKTFEVGLMAAPSSDTMLGCLGNDKDQTMGELREWVAVATQFLENFHAFLLKEGLDDSSKV